MPPKAMKRSASKSAGGARKKRATPVAKKCAIIAPTLKAAEFLPLPVRSIISDRLVHVFGTYKEDRHPFQKTVSDLVGQTLNTAQSGLQERITEAAAKKAAEDAEGATLSAASNNATADADAAAKASDDSKQALSDQGAALKSAKTALHDLKTEGETADATKVSTTAKKEKLEGLIKEFYTPVAEGSLAKGLGKSSTWAAKQLGREFEDLQKEFLVCVERTYSNPSSAWGTFDRIVEKELDKFLKQILARLEKELQEIEASTGPRAQRVEAAAAAVTGEEEKLKAAQEASNNAANAAKDAKKAAKGAASAVKQQEQKIDKAARVLAHAEEAMKVFKDGPLAAYTVVEAHEAPPPPPVQPEEPAAEPSQPAPAVDEAMTAAPPKAQRSTPSVLPSPGVLFSQGAQAMARAVGLSPRIAQSPR